MPKRNIDQIKELKYELGRYQKKVSDQQRRIEELKAALDTAEKGMPDLHRMMNGIMAEIGGRFGVPTPDGGFELVMSRKRLPEMLENFTVKTRILDDDNYIVRVDRREKEAEDGAEQ